MKKKLLFVVNVDWFFLSHRLPIALAALQEGYEVHLACALTDKREAIEKAGIILHPLGLERGKVSLAKEFISFLEMVRLFKKLRPDLVHLVTIKPVLFGGMAARWVGLPSVVAAVPGLGYVYTARGVAASLRRLLVGCLYWLALGGKNVGVIFQNEDNKEKLSRAASLKSEKTFLIRGSGVDLEKIMPKPLPEGVPIAVLPARLLADKGVREFVEAARILKARGIKARFCLVGDVDPSNPSSLTKDEIQKWVLEGVVEAWGYKADMSEVLAQASLVVLPSYSEGLPKALIEAAAAARPVVTTDIPGCRDAIESGASGVLVPVRDSKALADAMHWLLEDRAQASEMGKAGRLLAEKAFDIKTVVQEHLKIYHDISSV